MTKRFVYGSQEVTLNTTSTMNRATTTLDKDNLHLEIINDFVIKSYEKAAARLAQRHLHGENQAPTKAPVLSV